MKKNQKIKKRIACVTALLIILVMHLSIVYLAEHSQHDCTGHDCPVCAEINQCLNNLKTIGTAVLFESAVLFLFTSFQKKAVFKIAFHPCSSLISQKVRMNN